MSLNVVGLAAAMAAFLGVWLGHVYVRRLESASTTLGVPIALAGLIGLGLEVAAVLSRSPIVSAGLGILGMTALWDMLELRRQARRVAAGHAPANPSNPRHARLLLEGRATTVDWMAREPEGHRLTPEELAAHVRKLQTVPGPIERRGA
ncbi:MAG: DUF4491 family protein [Anaerolineales bacterium]|nr:DUF4491 family protein [Anaerolineales bacterium]